MFCPGSSFSVPLRPSHFLLCCQVRSLTDKEFISMSSFMVWTRIAGPYQDLTWIAGNKSLVSICRAEAARFVKLAQFHPRHSSSTGLHSQSFFLLLSGTKFKARIRTVKLHCYESLFEFSYRARIYKRSGLTGSKHLPTKSSVSLY
jgi:hypothetical protein